MSLGYYADRLCGERLRQCYETAPPRVKQYLDAEIRHVLSRVVPGDTVLELGCGYGRVALELAAVAGRVTGIDTARESLDLARKLARSLSACEFLEMDATAMEFEDGRFDAVVCVQNGICAFGVDRARLVQEALRVTRPGGRVLFSSYADDFWPTRLAWFALQAQQGFLGELDRDASRNGVIVCDDGFRADAMNGDAFERLCRRLELEPRIAVVDGSSVFCEFVKGVAA